METMIGILYSLTFPNGKKYLGITSRGALDRFRRHIKVAERGKDYPLSRAIRKYGKKNTKLKTLVIGTMSYLKDLEVSAIKHLNTRVPNGYNLTLGGETSPMSVPEVRRKLQGKNNGMWGTLSPMRGRPSPMRGKHYSLSTRKRMSAAHIGKTHTPETRKKISISRRGKNHPMWGKHHSSSTRKKMSISQTERQRRERRENETINR